ncbi:hypothetical protein E2C01_089205 [Portunus trituberculatus]|uniref:Uncharacterized protein n=1 Tax=Portunus trituberculatus TaxID=210409 RepID=A0A5B7JNY0_PORTR|nr:hypothetical protein [Portunus trituberculatus]
MARKVWTAMGLWASQVDSSMRIPRRVSTLGPACRMEVHCCIRDTGWLPTLVASCTRSMFSCTTPMQGRGQSSTGPTFWLRLSTKE